MSEASADSDTNSTVYTTFQTDMDTSRGNESESYAYFLPDAQVFCCLNFTPTAATGLACVIVDTENSRISAVGM